MGFWEGLGGLVGNFSGRFSNILRHVNDFREKLDFGGILEGSGEAFGWVLGGFWEGFGCSWGLSGLFFAMFGRFSVFGLFLPFFIVFCSFTAAFSGHPFPLACVRVFCLPSQV